MMMMRKEEAPPLTSELMAVLTRTVRIKLTEVMREGMVDDGAWFAFQVI